MVRSFLTLCAAVMSSGCGDTANSNHASQVPVAASGSPAGGSAPISVLGGTGGMPTLAGSGGVGGQASVGTPVGGSASVGGSGSPTSTKVEKYALVVTEGGGCALDSIGAIRCWGGKFTSGDAPSGRFLALVSDGAVVCGIREDAVLLCFAEPSDNSELLPAAAIEGVSAVGVDYRQIYWLDESGKISLGLVGRFGSALPAESERFSHVTAGYLFGCGLRRSDGSILCWDALPERPPASVDCSITDELGQRDAPSGAFSDMSTRDWTTCAVRNTGELACWGAGKGSNPNSLKTYPCDAKVTTTEAVPPPGKFRRVAMGWLYGCAVAEDGHVECWGNGTADTCVEGSVECRQARPPAGTFDQVAVRRFHSCAMTAARKITCWGYPGPAGGDGRTVPPRDFQ